MEMRVVIKSSVILFSERLLFFIGLQKLLNRHILHVAGDYPFYLAVTMDLSVAVQLLLQMDSVFAWNQCREERRCQMCL